MMAASAAGLAALSEGLGAARRVVLAGRPRPSALPHGPGLAWHPKDCLLALAGAALEAEGREVAFANPHFLPPADWEGDLAVLHAAPLDLACPLPVARNALLLDGEDLLGLAEERRAGEPRGLRRRRAELMDRLLTVAPEAVWAGLLPGGASPLPLAPLLAAAGRLPAVAAPVGWMACDLETGPYNFLGLRRDPEPGTSRIEVLAEAGRPALLAFATPGTLGDLAPALRAFAALEAAEARLLVFFFGAPEALAESLAGGFSGDNFRCPAIRFLFAPFPVAALLAALRAAAGCVESCHGGGIGALAEALGTRGRVVLGPGGVFDAWREGRALARGIAWEAVLTPAALAQRRRKAHRAGERALADALAALL
ncbi:hypothetical protein [Crenalkalicoccus roseus]|uniref:hypothetical protein n=1 Tax=Crenalkalicoccus roseus TaxID=1485588 RepID=UPI0010801618|nr:hypothetical protein [Crenalkalicoccus roseus]